LKPILIVKTGTTVANVRKRRGDFEDWIEAAMQAPGRSFEVASVFEGDPLPARPQSRFAGVVVTGSASMVSEREAWSERTAAWLPDVAAADIPLLGICYGHQLLAHGLGGRVGANPKGRQIGTVEVSFQARGDDSLLQSFAEQTLFQVSHCEAVLELPPGARRLAQTWLDPNHAFALGRRTWGVQFHPEFDDDVMRGYVEARCDDLRQEGIDPEAVSKAIRPSPGGSRLLRRFGDIAGDER